MPIVSERNQRTRLLLFVLHRGEPPAVAVPRRRAQPRRITASLRRPDEGDQRLGDLSCTEFDIDFGEGVPRRLEAIVRGLPTGCTPLPMAWVGNRRLSSRSTRVSATPRRGGGRSPRPGCLPSNWLRVSAEYHCSPLWTMPAGAIGWDSLTPHDYGLSAELVGALEDWAREYEAIYPDDDPGSAAFPSEQAERDFYARGRVLARRFATEVGRRFRVTYFGQSAEELISA